jgi:hypothetical protein
LLSQDPKEIRELGHDREEIDDLYKSAVRVKQYMNGGLDKIVERLE